MPGPGGGGGERGVGGAKGWELTRNGLKENSEGNGKILKQVTMMVTQFYEFTKNLNRKPLSLSSPKSLLYK